MLHPIAPQLHDDAGQRLLAEGADGSSEAGPYRAPHIEAAGPEQPGRINDRFLVPMLESRANPHRRSTQSASKVKASVLTVPTTTMAP